MRRFFYFRLALQNIRNNKKTYIPYILTVIGTVLMYYSFQCMADNPGIQDLRGGTVVAMIMGLGTFVIALFAVIFLFYTNSFLIKQRKKEFALFNILGMEKRHLGRILLWETLIVAAVGIAVGFGGGVLLTKLMYLFLLRLMDFPVQLGFYISFSALKSAVILFGLIFLFTWLNALRQIHLASPVQLLQQQKAGEQEPKTKLLMAILGVLCLGTGYYISITTESPITALTLFFAAVILVIIGTYLLFTAGSIAWLKFLRGRKRYYYKTRHFISVSGMLYRMKQNAVGLANICILSTMVLVMLSTTVALYAGSENMIHSRYPRELMVYANMVTESQADTYEEAVNQYLAENGLSAQNVISYREMYGAMVREGSNLRGPVGAQDMMVSAEAHFIRIDDFRQMTAGTLPEALKADQVFLLYRGNDIPGDTLGVSGLTFQIAGRMTFDEAGIDPAALTDSYNVADVYVILAADTGVLGQIETAVDQEIGVEDSIFYNCDPALDQLRYVYGFDLGDEAQVKAVQEQMSLLLTETGIPQGGIENRYDNTASYYEMNGGLLFLGVFLALLFVMAAVLIMYYKQISEGYDDRERYQIMQKVGLSRQEVRASIRSQVLSVFYLPLITAVIHVAFAFPIIVRLIALFNLNEVGLFLMTTVITVLVFAVLYAMVYAMTAKVYYRIVSE